MTEYGVFLLLGEILAFGLLVGKPVINLNNSITKLMEAVKTLTERFAEQRHDFEAFADDAERTHREQNEHLHRVDNRLENHEVRIERLEGKK